MALRLWLGFPKSLDVSKAIDKKLGAEREVIGNATDRRGDGTVYAIGHSGRLTSNMPITKEAKKWEGWGTALKPAVEPIILARKPLSEATVAENVLEWGTGGLNIDASRIAGYWERSTPWIDDIRGNRYNAKGNAKLARPPQKSHDKGRFPANILLDEEAAEMLDGQQAGASRFFYVAKASRSERTMGGKVENNHPTVKPIKLMRYLCRLITPPGGTVLDPFAGSGTTLIAAAEEGFSVIGIEREPEYCEIIRKRMAELQPALPLAE